LEDTPLSRWTILQKQRGERATVRGSLEALARSLGESLPPETTEGLDQVKALSRAGREGFLAGPTGAIGVDPQPGAVE